MDNVQLVPVKSPINSKSHQSQEELRTENERLENLNKKNQKTIKEYKHKINNVHKVSATDLLKTLDKPAYFIRQI
jgi:DNA anti-recombination protein RmuC